MNHSVDQLILKAKQAAKLGHPSEALLYIDQAIEVNPKNTKIFEIKALIGTQLNDISVKKSALSSLTHLAPGNLQYAIALAQLYLDTNQVDQAPRVFESLLETVKHPDINFNYAWFLTRAARYSEAIDHYERAINHGLQSSEEAYLNIAHIYSTWLFDSKQARKNLKKALELRPNYIDALYNLANLEEDSGDRTATESYFNQIRELKPDHAKATARLAMATENDGAANKLILDLEKFTQKETISVDERIDCFYALGKLYDQTEQFEAAFSSWQSANRLNKTIVGTFDRQKFSQWIDQLITFYSASWFRRLDTTVDAEPVFIGGMFRSGSTLLEQILASHPKVHAGGELDYFPRAFKRSSTVTMHGEVELRSTANGYEQLLRKVTPTGGLVTDKRPDNILYLGYIKSVFPGAKMLVTERNILDNCISIFSHRFGSNMSYACDLGDILFYYKELKRLTEHWNQVFPKSLHSIDYDDIVTNPHTVITDALRFLNLEWDENCNNFHQLRNSVSTASVWQVRKPIYQSSSGRWRNYSVHLDKLGRKS